MCSIAYASLAQVPDDADRPAIRLLMLPFEENCSGFLSANRSDGLRRDLVDRLSAVNGIAAQAIAVAAGGRDDLVAWFDGNTLLQAGFSCHGADRIAFDIEAVRIAPGGVDAVLSGSGPADALALSDALRDAILDELGAGQDPPQRLVDREAFDLYLDAVGAAGKRSYGQRLELVRAATELDSRFGDAWLQRGLLALKAGEQGGPDAACHFVESDKAYRTALDLDPATPLAVHGLASVQMRTGQTEAAAEILRAGLVSRPDFALLHAKLGYVNRYAGLMDQSVDEYRRSQALDRSYDSLIEGERQIVKSHIYKGDYERAFASYDRILQWLRLMGRGPDEKMLFYQGVARFYAGQDHKAVEYFDASIAESPGTVWSDFAAAYRSAVTADSGELVRLADELATGNVTDGERRYRLAHLYAMAEKPELALFHLEESAKSGFFNYPYTKSDRFLANIAESAEFKTILQFIYDRHVAYAQSASDHSNSRNTYEEAIRHALGLDYGYMPDHGTCSR